MNDLIVPVRGVMRRLRDMNDGTWAEVVYAAGTSGTSGGAGTSDTTEATQVQVLAAIRALKQWQTSFWTDDAGLYYSRREIYNEYDSTYTLEIRNPSTNAIVTPGTGFKPFFGSGSGSSSSSPYQITETEYQVTNAFGAYALGDVLYRVSMFNTSAMSADVVYWFDFTGAAVTGVTPSNVKPQSEYTTISSPDLGAVADVPAASDSGNYSLIALVKRSLGNWTAKIPALGITTEAASMPAVLPQTQIDAIKPPSTFPLATADAANLSTAATTNTSISTNLGAQSDAVASSDAGSFSVMAFVKRGLANWTTLQAKIPAIGKSTEAASMAVALPQTQIDAIKPPATYPLATTDSTNLATVATTNTALSTNLGAQADSVATSDSGAFSLIALVKRGLQNWPTLLARIPVLGKALEASSTPVVLPDTQIDLLKPPASMPLGSTDSTALASVVTNTAATNTLIGAQADAAATSDTATASYFSLFKRLLQSQTNLGTANGSAGTTQPTLASGASGILGYLRGIYDQLVSVVANLLLQKSLSETLWSDANNTVLIRQDVATIGGITTTYIKPDGTVVASPVSLVPLTGSGGGGSSATTAVKVTTYQVKNAFATYAVGDVLRRIDVISVLTGVVQNSVWVDFSNAAFTGVVEANIDLATETVNIGFAGVEVSQTRGLPAVCGTGAKGTLTINSASTITTALTVSTVGMNTVKFYYAPTGSITGGTLIFEEFDGTNSWVPARGARLAIAQFDAAFSLSGLIATGWMINAAGASQFRVRVSTVLTGTGSALLTAIPISATANSVTAGLESGTSVVVSSVTGTVNTTTNQPLPAQVAGSGTVAVTSDAIGGSAHNRGESFAIVFNVTAITLAPLIDVSVFESIDGSATYTRIYDFPRITATGQYVSPIFPQRGSLYRVSQTLSGTGTFTRSVTETCYQRRAPILYNFIDRTGLVILTAGSATPTYYCEGVNKFILDCAAATVITSAGTVQLQVSYTTGDGTANWRNVGGILTCLSTGGFVVVDAPGARFVRAVPITVAVGVGSLAGPFTIKATE